MNKNKEMLKRLRSIIENKFQTIKNASEELEIENSRLSAIINGRRPFAYEVIEKLSSFGISIDYIITGKGKAELNKFDFRAELNYLYPLKDVSIPNFIKRFQDIEFDMKMEFDENSDEFLAYTNSFALIDYKIDINTLLIVDKTKEVNDIMRLIIKSSTSDSIWGNSLTIRNNKKNWIYLIEKDKANSKTLIIRVVEYHNNSISITQDNAIKSYSIENFIEKLKTMEIFGIVSKLIRLDYELDEIASKEFDYGNIVGARGLNALINR